MDHNGSPLRLRPAGHSNLEGDVALLAEFFASPHVEHWWHESSDHESVRRYLTRDEPTHMLIALLEERPVGFGQWYRWDDYPEERDAYGIPAGTVGIDYLIAHAHDCDRGLGTALVAALVEVADPLPVWVTPEAANEPSCRVLEKNGFEQMAVKQCHLPDEPWAGPTALYRLRPGHSGDSSPTDSGRA